MLAVAGNEERDLGLARLAVRSAANEQSEGERAGARRLRCELASTGLGRTAVTGGLDGATEDIVRRAQSKRSSRRDARETGSFGVGARKGQRALRSAVT